MKGEANALICNKRVIKIFDKNLVGCKGTCSYDNEIFVYDLEPAHFIALLPNDTIAKVTCRDKIYSYTLPKYSTFYLPEHCNMKTSIFIIEHITKIPLDVLPHTKIMKPTPLTFNKAIETLQIDDYMSGNYTITYERRMSNMTRHIDLLYKRLNMTHVMAVKQIKEMDARFQRLHLMHMIFSALSTTVVVCLGIILCVCYCYCYRKNSKQTKIVFSDFKSRSRNKTVPSNSTELQPLPSIESVANLQTKIKDLENQIKKIKSELSAINGNVFETLTNTLSPVCKHQLKLNDQVNMHSREIYNINNDLGIHNQNFPALMPPAPEINQILPRRNPPLRPPTRTSPFASAKLN